MVEPGRGSRRGAGAFLIPEHDGELITADPRNQIVIADATTHEVGGLLEDIIADAVAVLIVVSLEIIDVEQEQRHQESLDAGFLDDLGEELAEIASVGQTGEVIGDGKALQAGVAFAEDVQLGEVFRQLSQKGCGGGLVLIGRKRQMQ